MKEAPSGQQIRRAIVAGLCPWCGQGPFKMLAGHTALKHGIGTRRLRDMGGFSYTEPICSPELSEQRTRENRDSQRAERINEAGLNGAGSPKRISAAGREKTRRALAQMKPDLEQLRAAGEKGRPAAIAATKRRAALMRLNAQHGTLRSYKFGCRCPDCRSANATASQEWRNKKKGQGS